MVKIKKFFNNGKPAWEMSASALAIAIGAIVVLALFADDSTQAMAWIAGLFKASAAAR